MFTGLITDVGTIREVSTTDAGREFVVAASYTGLAEGESIACDGACLTVRALGPGWFRVAAVTTTLERTTIGSWKAGRKVNLERAMLVDDRMGGHIVQGHVDGVGTVREIRTEGDALLLDIEVPQEVDELLVPLGSVTVDGVSLTVNALPGPGVVQVSVIEHTRTHTTLGSAKPGDRVQLEADVIAKYLKRLAAPLLNT